MNAVQLLQRCHRFSLRVEQWFGCPHQAHVQTLLLEVSMSLRCSESRLNPEFEEPEGAVLEQLVALCGP